MSERVAPTHYASLRIHFVFEVLCALGVSAVRFCNEVNSVFTVDDHSRQRYNVIPLRVDCVPALLRSIA